VRVWVLIFLCCLLLSRCLLNFFLATCVYSLLSASSLSVGILAPCATRSALQIRGGLACFLSRQCSVPGRARVLTLSHLSYFSLHLKRRPSRLCLSRALPLALCILCSST
jgi:hypothetical protein